MEYAVALAVNVPITMISVGKDNEDDFDGFIDLTEFLLSQSSSELQQVLLITYTFNEADVLSTLAE